MEGGCGEKKVEKCVALMKDLVQNFRKPLHLVLDAFLGTKSAATQHLMLDKRKRFVRFEKDSGRVETSVARLLKFFGCQVLNNNI